MVRPLKEILEVQFNLLYYLHMGVKDFEESDLREIDWLYGRLVKQKQDENDNRHEG